MLSTTKETAAALNVHPQTVRRMVKRGEIPQKYVTTIGNDYRYNLSAIEAHLLEREPAAPTVATPGAASVLRQPDPREMD